MKKEIGLPAIIAAVVVLVGVLGYFMYRAAAPAPLSVPDPKETRNRQIQGSRSTPAPAAPGQAAPPGPSGQ